MHASLATIGRACTVQEDEDPPATSLESSLDIQQVDYIEQSIRSCSSSVDELITLALSLCHSIKILPNFNKAIVLKNRCTDKEIDLIIKTDDTDNTNNNQQLVISEEHINSSTVNSTNTSVHTTITTTQNKPDDLNHLTYLHHFYLNLLHVVHFDTLNNTIKELSLGLLALLAHSENIIIKETNLLDCILSKFSISSSNIYSFQAIYEKKHSTNLLNDYHEFLLTTLLHFNDDSGNDDDDDDDNINGIHITGYTTTQQHYDHSSQLGELRVLCESLRQCWTQVKRLANEQRNMQYRLNQLNTSNNCDTILTKCFLDAYRINSMYSKLFTLAIINSAQYLIYSGVSLLGYMELSRFTHDELWEMTRGIEELSILRGHLHNVFQIYRNTNLYKLICNDKSIFHSAQIISPASTTTTTSISSTCNTLFQIISHNLLNDPVDVVFSISVGSLFSLFAKQRSLRLAHLIYLHLYRFQKLFFHETVDNHTDVNDFSSKNLLQNEFHTFIHDNHGLLASDYLRNEYEFISNFLDILSQSTDLLYQVQKLQLVCSSAAATIQVGQVEAGRRFQNRSNIIDLKNYPSASSASVSHAVSVEGKHGVLVRATSVNQPNATEIKDISSKTLQKTECHRRNDLLSNYPSRYQDTLHRSSTLDRYVATGSAVPPYSPISNHTIRADFTKLHSNDRLYSDDHKYKEDTNDSSDTTYNTTENISISNNKLNEQNKLKVSSKKGVQWSDHREVSTRHQIIGRYLEMTWKYTENTLTSLFLSISSTLINQKNVSGNEIVNENKLCKSTLIMSSAELLKLGNNICQLTATSDFFPTGLLPVLRKQALKCKEYAIWRIWYEEFQVHNCIPSQKEDNIKISISDKFNDELCGSTNATNCITLIPNETCDHLNHDSLYSIYQLYSKQNTTNNPTIHSAYNTDCILVDKCYNCCITMNLHQLWKSKSFLIITDINSIIQLFTYVTKLFVNDEQSWNTILLLIKDEIRASGISSIVHHFDISIPDSYKSLLLKLFKAYEFIRRLDIIFIRLFIMLKNMCYDEYNKCIMNWSTVLQQIDSNQHSQQQLSTNNNNIHQISYFYKQSLHMEMIFIHYENLIKCFKSLIHIALNNIISCILFWFGYTNEHINDEIVKEFKQMLNPMNSYFLSNLTSSTLTTTSTTFTSSNINDLVGIKTSLMNADKNIILRLARLMRSLSHMNDLLRSFDKNINIRKENLKETYFHIMNELLHRYTTIIHRNEILLSSDYDQQKQNNFLQLLTIFLKPIYKETGICLDSLTKTTNSTVNTSLLCEYHQYIFSYVIKQTIVMYFSLLSPLLDEMAINYDQFVQKNLMVHFQNQVPLNLLQEIYQSVNVHYTTSDESTSTCTQSTNLSEQPTAHISRQEGIELPAEKLASSLTDPMQLKNLLNSGSTGVELIQSTIVFVSSAMKNTMNKHIPKEPKEKIVSFAADVCSNLRLPFCNQATNNPNSCSKSTTSSSTTITTTDKEDSPKEKE
ncbi:hypothetical protein MN116_005883 [Schistosoma mekongi]|uniref:Uncharacterized protein n=1 Tax=Schistosoma mekongi TaxID=38744 RepID=A0AAE1ZBP2_SCHME|nr:hypothetical protein MN116_005883 [Schistosoma mekongi]